MQLKHQNKIGFQCCIKGESRELVYKGLRGSTGGIGVGQIQRLKSIQGNSGERFQSQFSCS